MKTKIILENGIMFEGESLGAYGETVGEVCFNTGMTGYQEIMTDPSYCNQIVIMTYPHIGNYGINFKDMESSKIQLAGLVVKEATQYPSNFRSRGSLNDYMKKQNIIGIQGIDTRMLTRIIRKEGAMNGIISSKNKSKSFLMEKLNLCKPMVGSDLVKKVTCKKSYYWNSKYDNNYKIAVLDFGIKNNILKMLDKLGCQIRIFPAKTQANTILSYKPDGILLSNGPGDPAAVTYGIKTVKALLGKKPIFGICLGHQILAHALGSRTYKLKFGHRGCNHPVKNLFTDNIEITSQNHGFVVDSQSLNSDIEVTHININDNTIAGLRCKNIPAFSVQYHPESSPGPHDSRYLFKIFIKMMSKQIHV